MSVLILPKSASIEALYTLRDALKKLREVNSVAWGAYLQQEDTKQDAPQQAQEAQQQAQQPRFAASAASSKSKARRRLSGTALQDASLLQPLLPGTQEAGGEPSSSRATGSARGSSTGGAAAAVAADLAALEAGQGQAPAAAASASAVRRSSSSPWLDETGATEEIEGEGEASGGGGGSEEEAHLLKSEKALTELYQLLDKLSEQLGLAKNELFVANLGGRPFLLPGVWWPGRQARHLPWAELDRMAVGIRRVARLLNSALFTFQGGFDRQLREALGPLFPEGLLPSLAEGASAAIQELLDAFPFEAEAGSAGLARYSAGVLAMVSVLSCINLL
ncbi:hypothetical protein COHA_008970 [Chlorella ohadii]|uniref:Uncharacterized protein n=1 Tax=Chlorella ohadii TaxID=2649997 RepID=A0AAD5DGC9_9CHLO|nr:hypothetical protein COHA_008970 [Chlorella ohadii]